MSAAVRRALDSPFVPAMVLIVAASTVAPLLVTDFVVTPAVLALGVIVGMTHGAVAVGLVLVFRTSGLLNLAQGEIGAFAAAVFAVWCADTAVDGRGLPYWLMLPVAVAMAAGISIAVERIVAHSARAAPAVVGLVLTLGIGTFLFLASLAVNTVVRNGAVYPRPPGFPEWTVGELILTPDLTAMLILTPVAVAALAVFLRFSRVGIGMRAAADNRESAILSGIPSGRMSALAWAIAGGFAAFAAVLQFPQRGYVFSTVALGPGLLVRALVAGAVARFTSLPVAFGFGVVIGVVEQVMLANVADGGAVEILLLLLLLCAALVQSLPESRLRGSVSWAEVRVWKPIPAVLRHDGVTRLARWGIWATALVVLVVGAMGSNRLALTSTLVIAYALVGLSVFVITGLCGDLSLGQFAIAGVGAITSVQVVDELVRSVPLGIMAGGLVGAVISVLLSLPSLRVRGPMLGVVTLGFAVACEAWLFHQPWAIGTGLEPARVVLFNEPIATAKGYFLFALPFLAAGMAAVALLERSTLGHDLVALRDNDEAARAFGIAVGRRKLVAFAIAGALAGVGGAVYAHSLPRLSVNLFAAGNSITAVAVAMIGGLSFVAGPVLGGLYLLALPVLLDLDDVGLALLALGWVALLALRPGGLAQVILPLRQRLIGWLMVRRGPEASSQRSVVGRIEKREVPEPPRVGRCLELDDVRKAFGGIAAVDGLTFSVQSGEAVGVIGPNGAGKTTLLELIGGAARLDCGSIRFGGEDIGRLPADARCRAGIVRTFQDPRLFSTLTAREVVLLALRHGCRSHPRFRRETRAGRSADEERARAQLERFGLAGQDDLAIGALSTGMRRIVELSAVTVMGPSLILLDEPSAGLAQPEVEALAAVITTMADQEGASLLIVEHDMPLIRAVCDRVVAMALGSVVADGDPSDVLDHPEVVASYLGTDRSTIERSGGPARLAERR